MVENYSGGVRRVISLATLEARKLDHPRVGTEHLLLGLLADDDCDLREVLRAAGASLAAARHMVAEAVGIGAGSPTTDALPFTQRAQRALERAARFSRKNREPEVAAGHVLLGVLDVEGLACQVLRGLGVDIVQLRNAVVGHTVPVEPANGPAAESPTDFPTESPNDFPADTAADTTTDTRTDTTTEPSTDAVRPRCSNCYATLDDSLAETLIPARRDGGPTTMISVVFCAACGATLGVLRPWPSPS